jgi:chlorobactene glucosyltransferase
MAWMHVAIIGALLVVLVQELLNLRALPRLGSPTSCPPPLPRPSVSVLIPARNEAARIARCLESWESELGPGTELLVLDDESTDDTRERARAVLAAIPRGRLLAGAPLPPGWAGKSFACQQLAEAARGEILVFADVDVEPRRGLLAALLDALEDGDTAGVTVLPRHTATSRLGRHLAPLQTWAVACFCPLWLGRRRSPALSVTNGQLLAIRRVAYEAVGGHRAVRGSLAEDAALGRYLAVAGFRLALVDGSALVSGATYETLAEAWRGNVKNLFPVLLSSHPLAWAASAGLVLGWVLPWVALGAGLDGGLGVAAGEIALGLASRLVAAHRFRQPLVHAWSHPLVVLLLAAMIASSAWRYRRGHVTWRGRAYAVGAHASAPGPVLGVPERTRS